jgi:hypothetical protein
MRVLAFEIHRESELAVPKTVLSLTWPALKEVTRFNS